MRAFRGIRFRGLMLITALAVVGCGEAEQFPTHPTTGIVTLDGQPFAGAEVWLVPKTEALAKATMTIRPYGRSAADGTVKFTTYLIEDGAPVGDYDVMIIKEAGAQGPTDDGDAVVATAAAKGKRGLRLPAKYGVPATSGLSATVKPTTNQFVFELKSK